MTDTALGGVSLPKGARTSILYEAGNHDETQFFEPERFDIRRTDAKKHLAFGKGIHFCVGAPLARLEGRIAFEQILRRLPNLRSNTEESPVRRPYLMLRGFEHLPLAWGRAGIRVPARGADVRTNQVSYLRLSAPLDAEAGRTDSNACSLARGWQQKDRQTGQHRAGDSRHTADRHEGDDMKTSRFLIIAFLLATPSMVMAQGTPEETQPTQGAEAKQQHIEAKKQTEVKGHVLPIIAGIRSAKMSAAALHELAVTEPFERRGARNFAELAEQAVRISRARADHLRDLKGLSAEARAEAEKATKKLKEARSTVERIQRQVGIVEAPFRKNEAESVRNESVRLHAELSDSERAIEKIADAYQVATNLDFSEMAPARQRE